MKKKMPDAVAMMPAKPTNFMKSMSKKRLLGAVAPMGDKGKRRLMKGMK